MRKVLGSISLLVLLLNTLLTPITYAGECEGILEISSENTEEVVEENGEEELAPEFSVEEKFDNEKIEDEITEEDELETENYTGDVEDLTGEVSEIGSGEVENLTGETVEGVTGDIMEVLTGTVEGSIGTGEEIVVEEIKYNEEPIIGEKTYNDVTVRVEALSGIFPEGTELTIIPIKWWNLSNLKEKLVEEKEEVKEDTTVVAFDISFIYSGEEVQPKEGEKVKVTFDYSNNEDIVEADKNDNQEVKVYHIEDKDEEGNKLEDEEKKIRDVTNVEESEEEGIAVAEGEKFSIYAVVTVTGTPETVHVTYNLSGGYWAEDHGITPKTIEYTCSNGSCEVTTPFKTPSRTGYMFMGWYDATLTNRRKDGVVTDGMIVYANWQEFENLDVYIIENESNSGHYTLMDRNLGAKVIYNGNYSNPNEGSRGYYYQWGNNYGFDEYTTDNFPLSPIVSETKDVSSYSRSNPYYSSFFRGKGGSSITNWMSSINKDLWGDKTNTQESRQGPCPDGYHLPIRDEYNNILSLYNKLINVSKEKLTRYLLMPPAGIRDRGYSTVGVVTNPTYYRYITSSWYNEVFTSKDVWFFGADNDNNGMKLDKEWSANGLSARCFLNNEKVNDKYNIYLNGGGQAIITILSGVVQSFNEPYREFYDFDGWYTSPNFEGDPIEVGSVLLPGSSLYAKWGGFDRYTITYDLHGGFMKFSNNIRESNISEYATNTNTFTLKNPVKLNSIFRGWSGTNLSSPTKTVTITKGSIGDRIYEALYDCESGYSLDENNDCVGVRNADGTLNFDVWEYGTVDFVVGNTKITMLDRNLGATSNDINDAGSQGFYYKWGNNYGFSGDHTSKYGSTNVRIPDVSGYGPGTLSGYYISPDWIVGGDKGLAGNWFINVNFDLWGDITDTLQARQGPCPVEYHIPSDNEILSVIDLLSDFSSTSTGVQCINLYGNKRKCFQNLLKIPDSGYIASSKSNSSEKSELQRIFLWTSSDYDNTSMTAFHSTKDHIDMTIGERSSAAGIQVRCFKNIEKVKVKYNFNGGYYGDHNYSKLDIEDDWWNLSKDTISPLSLLMKRDNSTFSGWYLDSGFTKPFTGGTILPYATQDTTFYAKFDCNAPYITSEDGQSCTLLYNTVTLQDGEISSSVEIVSGSSMEEPIPLGMTGYTFTGWYIGDVKVEFPLIITGDITLIARYVKDSYTINFYNDKNKNELITGGTFAYNTVIDSGTVSNPIKIDYDFIGWKTITGDNDISFPLRVTGDLDIYANFESPKYENLIGWDGCYEYRTYTGEDEGQYFAEITSYSGSCNKENLTITGIITRNNRNYLVKIIGSNAFSNKGLSGILTLQEGVEIVNSHSFNNNLIAGLNLPNSLIQINEGAFDGNSDLESINFGNGLETIGDSAFAKCGLKSLNFPSSLKIIGSYGTNGAFADNLQLEEVNFNEGLQEIRGYSFDHTNVVRFVMPSTLKKIGRTAFNRDSSLVELVLNEGLEEIGSYAFGANSNLKNIIIPSTVTSMGNSLFYNRQELTPIENLVFKSKMDLSNTSDNYFDGLSSTLKTLFRDGSGTIRNYMFSSLYNLESITFGSDVTEIGYNNFQNTKVSDLKIPGNIKVIGSSAFSNSKNLTSIEIETGVQSIGNSSFSSNNLSELFIPDSVIRLDSSFYNPNGIKKIVIGNGVITLPSGIFNKSEEVIIGNSVGELSSSNFSDGTNLKKIKIGDGVTNINRGTFIDAKNLEEIEIGNSLIELKYPVFGGTPNLKNLKLGNSLQKIGSGEFAGALITGLILPASLQEIGTGAFLNNINLSSIIFTGNSNIQKIWSKAFNNAEITGIVLPSTLTKLGTQVFCSDGISSEGSVIGLIDKSLEEINDLENQDATACFVLKNDSKFSYTVTYDAASHSGTIINQPILGEEVPYNTTIILPTENIVSQKGYQFIGWTKVLGGTEPMTEDQIITSDVTFYPVFKKDTEQRVVTFSGNGATLNGNNGIEITIPCTIPAVYNTGIQATTCPITTPSIQREGYEILGYSIDKNYKNICAITGNQEIQISGNELYYAITKKNLTATFNKNGNTAQIKHGESETTESIIEESCSIWNQETECKVRTPLILPATGKTTIGYTTSTISSGENLTGENTEIILSTSPMSYYAWTQSTPQEVKVNYVYSTGVIQGATTENSCWTEVRYNGDENQTGCMITLPILQVREGYEAPKWYRTESEVVETDNENRAMFFYESSPITLTGKAEVSGTISYVVKHYFQMLENDVITNKYALNQSYTDVGLSGEVDTILILSGLKKEVEGFEYFKATVNGQPVNDIIDISQEIEYAETYQLTTPVEIKLLYTRNKYEYTLNQIDNVSTEGSTASNANMYYGQMIVLSGAVTNDCYERSGWQGLPENVENTYYITFPMPAGNVIIAPTVDEKTYIIEFDKNAEEAEGSVPAKENVRCSVQVQLDPNNVYTRNGYVFKEWNTNSDGTGTGYAKDAIITTALTKTGGAIVKLYAQWIANTYKVTFNANGGAVTQIEKMVTYDQPYGVLPVPTREGYAFSGWYTQEEGGEYITGTTKVIRTEDHILYAQWIANKYTVTFDVNSGVVIPKTIEVTYNQPYGDLPTPGRVGYTFQGWYTAKDGGTQVNQATQVITPNNHKLYAHWNVNSYTISYNLNGGQLPVGKINPEAYTIESGNITLNNPIREGYDFIGWSGTDLTELTTEVIITQGSIGNREYKANWKIKTYTITWMNSTGSLLEKDENVEYGSMPSYDGEEPTSGGNVQYTYSFSGWNPQTGMVVEDQVYTAVYNSIVNQYAVTFVDEDGTVLKVATNYDYDTSVSDIEKPADPTKVADAQYTYSFAGWNPEIHNVTGAQVYTATYDRTINKYNVLWKNRDGHVLETDEDVEYGSNPKYDGDTPISGETVEYQYRFAGWNPSITNETIIEGDTVYTATYEQIKRKYQITWIDYDNQIIDTTEVDYGMIPSHDAPIRTGHDFNDWDPIPVEVVGPASYKATYTIKQYTVTPEKGVGVADILGGGTYDYGTEIILTGIAKEGYHFEGGVTIKEFNVEVPAKNITVRITAQPNTYYVHFKNNGGEGVMNDQEFTYDQEQALISNAYTRDGFTFVSWTDGEGGIYKDKAVVKNLATSGTINLIAQWIEGDVPGPIPPSPTPSGGGGGGGGGMSIDDKTEEKQHDSAEDKQQEKESKEDQNNKDKGVYTGGNVKTLTGDSSIVVPEPVYKRTEEELTAYKYAYKYGITTLAPEYAAMPDDYVQRGHMAKMVVNYALNVLHRKLPEKLPRKCRWLDGRNAWESQEIKNYAEKSCALGIMGIDMKYFQPKKYVTRAQFGTIIGRLMWGKLPSKPYYAGHLARLKERGIMTQIENPENRIEIRKWAWLMFMRMEKYMM